MRTLDELKRATAEMDDPVDIWEEWLEDLGWQRPHGAWCGCMGCDPFFYHDDCYTMLGDPDGLRSGFVAIANAVHRDEAVWDDTCQMAISTDADFLAGVAA